MTRDLGKRELARCLKSCRVEFKCRRQAIVNIPQPLIEAYGELRPYLQEVEKRLTDALRPYAQERLLPLIGRVKTIESAAEKIETGRYKSFRGPR
jgi:hypothetical protein